uniref:Large ribosomal subunit protein bL9c n=1 Tax=Titanophycus setchellii TaxID=940129 RepID=A0A1G4NYE4_9FLOR|nr:Ribosomal protein L9 [Titanophycus setchellii]SCW23677.1 Ribosomal protein L9 [Titanophycus setchellii]
MAKKKIQLILNLNQKHLGNHGDIIKVNPGYAKNYLLPKKIAEPITKNKLNYIRYKTKQDKLILEAKQKLALDTKSQLEAIYKFSIKRKVSEHDHIFGSINDKDVVEIIKNITGITLEKSQVTLPEIKNIGLYDISIQLMPDIDVQLKLQILPETI